MSCHGYLTSQSNIQLLLVHLNYFPLFPSNTLSSTHNYFNLLHIWIMSCRKRMSLTCPFAVTINNRWYASFKLETKDTMNQLHEGASQIMITEHSISSASKWFLFACNWIFIWINSSLRPATEKKKNSTNTSL